MSGKIFGKKRNREKSFFQLLDEAYFLVRDFRLELLPIYFLANIPLISVLMYAIYELGCLRVNDEDVVVWGIAMTLAFLWKCFFQCAYCSKMMRIISGGGEKLSVGQLVTGGCRIFILTSLQLLLLTLIIASPLVMIVFIPLCIFFLPFLYCTTGIVCATVPEAGIVTLTRKIFWYLSRRPVVTMAGSLVILLISFVITVNVIVGASIIPVILKKFFDVDTAFSTVASIDGFIHLIFNSTIWSIIFCLSWLLLEPLFTSYSLLLVFYGESKEKGLDLKAEVRRFTRNTVLVIALMAVTGSVPISVQAEREPAVSIKKEQAERVEKKISQTLKKSEFRWRDEFIEPDEKSESWLSKYLSICFEKLGEWIKKYGKIIGQYLDKLFSFRSSPGGESTNWDKIWGVSKYLIIAFVAIVIVYAIYYYWRNRRNKSELVQGSGLKAMPDLKDEKLTADELEQGEWLNLGNELLNKAEYALALRAFYLGCISALAERRLLSVAVGKSDYEYLSELRRRGHSEPALISGFSGAIVVFQQVWYGNYPADREQADDLRRRAQTFARKDDSEGGEA